jgi:hypothetical protein
MSSILNEKERKEMMTDSTWETQEVIDFLINDEICYCNLKNKSARFIHTYVSAGNAPQGLYDSFAEPPKSYWKDVDWNEVADSLKEE